VSQFPETVAQVLELSLQVSPKESPVKSPLAGDIITPLLDIGTCPVRVKDPTGTYKAGLTGFSAERVNVPLSTDIKYPVADMGTCPVKAKEAFPTALIIPDVEIGILDDKDNEATAGLMKGPAQALLNLESSQSPVVAAHVLIAISYSLIYTQRGTGQPLHLGQQAIPKWFYLQFDYDLSFPGQ